MGETEPYCILRHGRKSHTWGELRQAAGHTMRDAPWLGQNVDLERSGRNAVLAGTGDVVEDVRARLAAVGVDPKPGQVVARELLLTASSAHFAAGGHSGRDGDFAPDRLNAWRETSMAFLREEFGANLCTVVLHLDEAVPHLHAWVTTTAHVEKKGRGRPRKDGTRPAVTTGWTLNHDKVMGSGKAAFAARQDRYAEAMAPLGLRRGQRHSRAHHEPIRAYYARLPELAAKAEAERLAARDLRLAAEQDAIRRTIERQAAQIATEQARQARRESAESRKATLAAQAQAEEASRHTATLEREALDLRACLQGERGALADQKGQMRRFVELRGLGREFDAWDADDKAINNLRQAKGEDWGAYERALTSYAADLRQYGTWRDAIVRRGERHLRFLFETGAQALGHVSALRNPSRVVVDGVLAWLRIEGGDALVLRHRTVIGWLREAWATMTEAAIKPPERDRGRER